MSDQPENNFDGPYETDEQLLEAVAIHAGSDAANLLEAAVKKNG